MNFDFIQFWNKACDDSCAMRMQTDNFIEVVLESKNNKNKSR